MRLMLSLLLSAARFKFSFVAKHITGLLNEVADARSRLNWHAFRHLAPSALPHPVTVPQELLAESTSLTSISAAGVSSLRAWLRPRGVLTQRDRKGQDDVLLTIVNSLDLSLPD